jgi:hypothetical protein
MLIFVIRSHYVAPRRTRAKKHISGKKEPGRPELRSSSLYAALGASSASFAGSPSKSAVRSSRRSNTGLSSGVVIAVMASSSPSPFCKRSGIAAKSAGRFWRAVTTAVRRACTSAWMGAAMSVMELGSSAAARPDREDSPPPSRAVFRSSRASAPWATSGLVMSVMALRSPSPSAAERGDSPPPSRAVVSASRRSATSPGRGPVVPTLLGSCLLR